MILENIIKKIGGWKNIIEFSATTSIVCYVSGFIIWNTYIQGLGFRDNAIFKTRYIYSGFAYLVFFLILAIIMIFIIRLFGSLMCSLNYRQEVNNIKEKCESYLQLILLFLVVLYFIGLFIYSIFLFYKIPQFIGGGQAMAISLIGNEEKIAELSKFGIKIMPGGNVETEKLCVAYEGDNFIILALEDRIISVKKDFFWGNGAIQTKKRAGFENGTCIQLIERLIPEYLWNLIVKNGADNYDCR
jgi:hypothetical protein